MGVSVARSPARLEFGRVLRQSVRFVGRRWATLALLVLILGWAPQLVITFYTDRLLLLGKLTSTTVAVAMMFAGLISQAAAIACVLNGPSAPLSAPQAALVGLRAAPRLSLLWFILIAPSAIQLWLLPQHMDWVEEWSATLARVELAVSLCFVYLLAVYPAVVLAERRGPISSISRSVTLMAGTRWKVLVLYLLVMLMGFVPTLTAIITSTWAIDFSSGASGFASATTPFLQDVVGVLWAVVTAEAYLELSGRPDSETAGRLDDIFG